MTWNKLSYIIRRLQFVKLVRQSHRNVSALCRQFGFSRRVGYKWIRRFERNGRRGLKDQSRRPRRSPRQMAPKWLKRIRQWHRAHRSWGSRKLAACLRKEYGRAGSPSVRTVSNWLKRLGLNRRTGRRRTRRGPCLKRPQLTLARRSNQVWTVDFKGWFRTRDGCRVDPLTVRDLFSRYLLSIRLLRNQSWEPVRREFLRLFGRYGYPEVIRVDNGSPFGSTGPAGLSRLSAWWRSLGIGVEFIAPGHPEQNGAHEQMHRVFKAETARRASRDLRSQQRRTDRWTRIYNQVRPHQGLGQRTPAEVYRWRARQSGRGSIKYPARWILRRVRSNGQIKWKGRKRFVGEAFIGYTVGLKAVPKGKSMVHFAGVLIGEIWDADSGGMRPAIYARRVGSRPVRT